jgi:glycosyltransferase involved in cell wall biosynthesis
MDERMKRFAGMYRIRNEAKWIKEVIESALPLCERIFIMDDHSDDGTYEICQEFDDRQVTVFRSPFQPGDLDETRDKNWLYKKILDAYPTDEHGYHWPGWICCIDGDEVFEEAALDTIRIEAVRTNANALSLRIFYLWDRPDQIRVDRVYGDFHRPSIFRVINPNFTWQQTPWKGNLHCSSIPQEFLHQSIKIEAALWHYGYMDRERRLAKHAWYNKVDPGNHHEDCYNHMVMGDLPEFPAGEKRKWAGPLELVDIPERRHLAELAERADKLNR